MPMVRVYIRAEPYKKLLKECMNDPEKVPAKIAKLVHEKYE